MAKIVVEVMPKSEILDPQGQAIQKALARLGFDTVTSVRQGKRFEVEIDGAPNEEIIRQVTEMAEKLLANTVIEDFKVCAG